MISKTKFLALIYCLVITSVGFTQRNGTPQAATIEVHFDKVLVTPHTSQVDSSLAPLIGFLHSHPEDSASWAKYVKPLRPNFWRNKDYFPEYHKWALNYNADFHYQMSLAGGYPAYKKEKEHPHWPQNDYGKWTSFRSDKMIKIPEGIDNFSIDIWNEPNHKTYWPDSDSTFFEMFCETINWLNTNYPNCPVAGPSSTGSTGRKFIDDLIPFMRRWKKRNPDKSLDLNMLAVHGLGQSHEDFMKDLIHLSGKVNSKEWADVGIQSIIYNEYLKSSESTSFSWSLKKLEAFEKYGVKYAARACWGTCQNGSLDGLLVEDENGILKPTENWFGYAAYALMRGKRYEVTNNSDLAIIAGEQENGSKLILVSNVTTGPEADLRLNLNSKSSKRWNIYQITDNGFELKFDHFGENLNFTIQRREHYLISEASISP